MYFFAKSYKKSNSNNNKKNEKTHTLWSPCKLIGNKYYLELPLQLATVVNTQVKNLHWTKRLCSISDTF